jgi:kynurenine formamidase
LIRTGWSKRWPNRREYLGDDTAGDASNLHFPGVSAEVAEVLVECDVAAVGIDTASVDHGPSQDFMAHRALMAADIPEQGALAGRTALAAVRKQLPQGSLVSAPRRALQRRKRGPLPAMVRTGAPATTRRGVRSSLR